MPSVLTPFFPLGSVTADLLLGVVWPPMSAGVAGWDERPQATGEVAQATRLMKPPRPVWPAIRRAGSRRARRNQDSARCRPTRARTSRPRPPWFLTREKDQARAP